jgi:hypothetical protein
MVRPGADAPPQPHGPSAAVRRTDVCCEYSFYFISDAVRTCREEPISADVIPTACVLIFAGVLVSSVMLDVDWCGHPTRPGHWKASQEDV